jgi:dTDP-4-dehydrorhamnose reductase
MKFIITGMAGTLGRAVTDAIDRRGEHTWDGTFHHQLDITNPMRVSNVLGVGADYLINCAGAIPERVPNAVEMVKVNAIGPHVLAEVCEARGIRLVHVSTDCVYSHLSGHFLHATRDVAPDTLYGRSKLAGEPESALVVRTSFASPDAGFWKWVADTIAEDAVDAGGIYGWTAAHWSGSTVWAVADAIIDLCERGYEKSVINLATKAPSTKFAALMALRERAGLPFFDIVPSTSPQVMRGMFPDVELPNFADALEERSGW